MGELLWPVVLGAVVVAAWAAYVIRQEWLSRIRFPDDELHENGPFDR